MIWFLFFTLSSTPISAVLLLLLSIILNTPASIFVLREYHIHAGKTEMAASLKKQFPGEEQAIDEFMRLMKVE